MVLAPTPSLPKETTNESPTATSGDIVVSCSRDLNVNSQQQKRRRRTTTQKTESATRNEEQELEHDKSEEQDDPRTKLWSWMRYRNHHRKLSATIQISLVVSIFFFMGIFSIFHRQSNRTTRTGSFAINTSPGTSTGATAMTMSDTTAPAVVDAASVVDNNTSRLQQQQSQRRQVLEDRLRGALWGYFAGDALAAPTHWYYGGLSQIKSDYGRQGIVDYTKPNYYLPGSILNKSDLNGGGRSKISAGGLFGRSGRDTITWNDKPVKTIIGDVINHGKQDLWSPGKGIHYHATLDTGENTLEVSIARVLMKSIVEAGGTFDADHFRNAYIQFMTTPNSHNDVYASTCHRMFFANLVFGQKPPKDCPDNDSHNVDTIDGLVLPTIVAMTGIGGGGGNGDGNIDMNAVQSAAAQCASVTRKSNVLERVSSAWSSVVVSSLVDDTTGNNNGIHYNFQESLSTFSKQTIGRLPNPKSRDADSMSACYLSSALPGLLDLVAKYNYVDNPKGSGGGSNDGVVWDGLIANANVGGENVHRGSVIGAILGARAGYNQLPSHIMEGLYHRKELEQEINDFVNAVLIDVPSSEEEQQQQ